MEPRRGDRHSVAPPGLYRFGMNHRFQGFASLTPGYRRPPLRGSNRRLTYPNNSSIGLPLGNTGIGRPLFRYSARVSTPKCRYTVASMSCGVFGLVFGNAAFSSDSPTIVPPRTPPPATAALKTFG